MTLPRRFRCVAAVLVSTVAMSVWGALSVERDASSGISWICGEDGGRIVGVGRVNVKQGGWRCDVSATEAQDKVVFCFEASGGKSAPHGWTFRMPLGKDAEKTAREKVFKIGRWRRHPAGLEAQPVETSLGKYKVVKSPHGTVMFSLPGGETWSGDNFESIDFPMSKGAPLGDVSREMSVWPMRKGEEAYECAARVNGVPFALKIGCPVRNNLYASGDAILDYAVTETAGCRMDSAALEIVVRNWDGLEAAAWSEKIRLAPFERHCGRKTVPTPGRGIYFVEMRVESDGQEEFTRTSFAVIPPFEFRHNSKPVFGINMRLGSVFRDEVEEEYALVKRLGMRYVRDGDNRVARRHGMEAGVLRNMPKHDFRAGSEDDAKAVSSWLDEIADSGTRLFEFGNEIGHFSNETERHVLYDRYSGWLDVIRAERERRGMDFKIMYGTSSKRPELVRLIAEKGIFGKLDAFVVHPGRLHWTPDMDGEGWKYRGLISGSKRLYAELGFPDTPVFLTETYTKSKPHSEGADSLRQTAENAVLNSVVAAAEGVAGFCAYQLHEGVSYDENGIDTNDVEYSYGILNRDNSLKPAAIGYETAAEELDGAKFVREATIPETQLHAFLFDTPSGPLAVLLDRTEGCDLRTQGPRLRAKGESFFHFEPWLDNWRVKTHYVFAAADGVKSVEVRDVVGRTRTCPVEGGKVRLELTGSPVFMRGLNPGQFETIAAAIAARQIAGGAANGEVEKMKFQIAKQHKESK